ncbi:glycoside hydrolase family 43 [Mucilaginibacter paludis DSM 18603]|uniref:Glycoside hydrolase family 43 n=2 Tax=Mucilaginibacter TaxID=423349 RepID=H1YFI1_9SPHI|nr:glycoside hydrolase family 43 [Mucilaginibacter paludis DSM 18603]
MKRCCCIILLLFSSTMLCGQTQQRISVHDPVMIKQDSLYYIFCTGRGVSVWSSTNRVDWKREKPVLATAPAWTLTEVPNTKANDIWAPDISYEHGRYYLFYSSSVFGKNSSAIGLATNKTLHSDSPDFKWEDLGMVVKTIPGQDQFNAIDPNLILDEQGKPWLTFGSFWNGITLVRLSDDLKTVIDTKPWRIIAARSHNKNQPGSTAGSKAIEAPFLFKKGKYYYLFTSWDYCCRGPKSNYKIMVGRSKNITGPYLDREGVKLENGGGTLVLAGDKDWYGVGHNAVVSFDGIDYLVFHAYDASDNGRSKLRIEQLDWDNDGWPVLKIE